MQIICSLRVTQCVHTLNAYYAIVMGELRLLRTPPPLPPSSSTHPPPPYYILRRCDNHTCDVNFQRIYDNLILLIDVVHVNWVIDNGFVFFRYFSHNFHFILHLIFFRYPLRFSSSLLWIHSIFCLFVSLRNVVALMKEAKK